MNGQATAAAKTVSKSKVKQYGLNTVVQDVIGKMRALYLSDATPWVIGYSGGKDSTAVLQFTWMMLAEMSMAERTKTVHVISTDTLVENPIVSGWVKESHKKLQANAATQQLPIETHLLTPAVKDTFWVNLIGKGYPAPRHKMRWCTDRLKIRPSNTFVREVVSQYGEAIMVLGMRKAESSGRANILERYEGREVRDQLTPSNSLPNCLIFNPIGDWTNDDVWLFLMQKQNPWGHTNKDLLTMYRGASADNECPLVVDDTTPSCGNSRFGCWVCTLVDRDKSMDAMIKNDAEKEWMRPLLEFRNEIDFRGDENRTKDRERRDFRRMNGSVTMKDGNAIPGPYTQDARRYWLQRVLEIQKHMEENAPAELGTIELITMEELEEIRRMWVEDKHEIEDVLPSVYESVLGRPFPTQRRYSSGLAQTTLDELKAMTTDEPLKFELVRSLLGIEQDYESMTRRVGIHQRIRDELKKTGYVDRKDAEQVAAVKQGRLSVLEEEDVHRIHEAIETIGRRETS
jgi:DNA sulfur modification protein DndC